MIKVWEEIKSNHWLTQLGYYLHLIQLQKELQKAVNWGHYLSKDKFILRVNSDIQAKVEETKNQAMLKKEWLEIGVIEKEQLLLRKRL